MHIADLAMTLRRAGHQVELLTVRWDLHWSAGFQFLEFPVHRIGPAPGPWSSFRFYRNLTRKLTELEPNRVIVFGIRDEAYAIARSVGGKIPIVLREDVEPQIQETRKRQAFTLNAAETILVDSPLVVDRLSGYMSDGANRIEAMPMGITIPSGGNRMPNRQAASRNAVSDAHPMLMIDSDQPLVVCGSALEGDPGFLDLIDVWPSVLRRFPGARLWIVGEGSQGRDVWDRIIRLNLVNSAVMPGSFDDLTDVFDAADVYVHPSRSGRGSGLLTRAMAAGLCPIVISAPEMAAPIQNEVDGLVAGPASSQALADQIIRALDDRELRDQLGCAALNLAKKMFDIENLANAYLGKRSSAQLDSSRPAEHPPRSVPSSSP